MKNNISKLILLFIIMISFYSVYSQDKKQGTYFVLHFPKDTVTKYYNTDTFAYFIFVLHKSLVSSNYQLEATAFSKNNNVINTFEISKIDNNQKVSLPNVFNHGIYSLTKSYMKLRGMDGSSGDYDLTPESKDGKFVDYNVSCDGVGLTSFDLNPSPPGGISTLTPNTIRKHRIKKPHQHKK